MEKEIKSETKKMWCGWSTEFLQNVQIYIEIYFSSTLWFRACILGKNKHPACAVACHDLICVSNMEWNLYWWLFVFYFFCFVSNASCFSLTISLYFMKISIKVFCVNLYCFVIMLWMNKEKCCVLFRKAGDFLLIFAFI